MLTLTSMSTIHIKHVIQRQNTVLAHGLYDQSIIGWISWQRNYCTCRWCQWDYLTSSEPPTDCLVTSWIVIRVGGNSAWKANRVVIVPWSAGASALLSSARCLNWLWLCNCPLFCWSTDWSTEEIENIQSSVRYEIWPDPDSWIG